MLRHGNGPFDWITRTGGRTLPNSAWRCSEFGRAKLFGYSRRPHDRTARIRIDAAVPVAHAVEHNVGSVIQLQPEPIPPNLFLRQLIGPEFMIHPGFAGHRKTMVAHA